MVARLGDDAREPPEGGLRELRPLARDGRGLPVGTDGGVVRLFHRDDVEVLVDGAGKRRAAEELEVVRLGPHDEDAVVVHEARRRLGVRVDKRHGRALHARPATEAQQPNRDPAAREALAHEVGVRRRRAFAPVGHERARQRLLRERGLVGRVVEQLLHHVDQPLLVAARHEREEHRVGVDAARAEDRAEQVRLLRAHVVGPPRRAVELDERRVRRHLDQDGDAPRVLVVAAEHAAHLGGHHHAVEVPHLHGFLLFHLVELGAGLEPLVEDEHLAQPRLEQPCARQVVAHKRRAHLTAHARHVGEFRLGLRLRQLRREHHDGKAVLAELSHEVGEVLGEPEHQHQPLDALWLGQLRLERLLRRLQDALALLSRRRSLRLLLLSLRLAVPLLNQPRRAHLAGGHVARGL